MKRTTTSTYTGGAAAGYAKHSHGVSELHTSTPPAISLNIRGDDTPPLSATTSGASILTRAEYVAASPTQQYFPQDFTLSLLSQLAYISYDKKNQNLANILQLDLEFDNAKEQSKFDFLKLHAVKFTEYLQNWQVLEVKENSDCQYRGVAFVNHNTKQLVVAHRGTVIPNKKSLFSLRDHDSAVQTDVNLIVKNDENLSRQKDYALNLSEHIIEKVLSDERFTDYSLCFTGHSLGSYLAEISQFLCLKHYGTTTEKYPHIKFVGFDGPGAKENLDLLRSHITDIPTLQESTHLLKTHYLVYPPTAVSACGAHDGRVFMIDQSAKSGTIELSAATPQIEASEKSAIALKIDQLLSSCCYSAGSSQQLREPTILKILHEIIYNLSGHSLKNIILHFNADPVTGMPKKLIQATDWPRLDIRVDNSQNVINNILKIALGKDLHRTNLDALYSMLKKLLAQDFKLENLLLSDLDYLAENHENLKPLILQPIKRQAFAEINPDEKIINLHDPRDKLLYDLKSNLHLFNIIDFPTLKEIKQLTDLYEINRESGRFKLSIIDSNYSYFYLYEAASYLQYKYHFDLKILASLKPKSCGNNIKAEIIDLPHQDAQKANIIDKLYNDQIVILKDFNNNNKASLLARSAASDIEKTIHANSIITIDVSNEISFRNSLNEILSKLDITIDSDDNANKLAQLLNELENYEHATIIIENTPPEAIENLLNIIGTNYHDNLSFIFTLNNTASFLTADKIENIENHLKNIKQINFIELEDLSEADTKKYIEAIFSSSSKLNPVTIDQIFNITGNNLRKIEYLSEKFNNKTGAPVDLIVANIVDEKIANIGNKIAKFLKLVQNNKIPKSVTEDSEEILIFDKSDLKELYFYYDIDLVDIGEYFIYEYHGSDDYSDITITAEDMIAFTELAANYLNDASVSAKYKLHYFKNLYFQLLSKKSSELTDNEKTIISKYSNLLIADSFDSLDKDEKDNAISCLKPLTEYLSELDRDALEKITFMDELLASVVSDPYASSELKVKQILESQNIDYDEKGIFDSSLDLDISSLNNQQLSSLIELYKHHNKIFNTEISDNNKFKNFLNTILDKLKQDSQQFTDLNDNYIQDILDVLTIVFSIIEFAKYDNYLGIILEFENNLSKLYLSNTTYEDVIKLNNLILKNISEIAKENSLNIEVYNNYIFQILNLNNIFIDKTGTKFTEDINETNFYLAHIFANIINNNEDLIDNKILNKFTDLILIILDTELNFDDEFDNNHHKNIINALVSITNEENLELLNDLINRYFKNISVNGKKSTDIEDEKFIKLLIDLIEIIDNSNSDVNQKLQPLKLPLVKSLFLVYKDKESFDMASICLKHIEYYSNYYNIDYDENVIFLTDDQQNEDLSTNADKELLALSELLKSKAETELPPVDDSPEVGLTGCCTIM